MSLFKSLSITAAVLLIAFIAWDYLDGTHSSIVHFRLTVEGEQNGQKVTGSVVWATRLHRRCELALPDCRDGWLDGKFSGQAFKVGIGDDALWITVSEDPRLTQISTVPNPSMPMFLPVMAWNLDSGSIEEAISGLDAVSKRKDRRELDIRFLPRVIRFGNQLNPLSAQPATFPYDGKVTLLRAFIVFTQDAVDRDILQQLPWLSQKFPFDLPNKTADTPRPFATRNLNKTNFIRSEL